MKEDDKYLWKVYYGQTARSHGSDVNFAYAGYEHPMTKAEAWEFAKEIVRPRVKMQIKDLHWFWIQPSFSGNNLSITDCDNMRYGWNKDKSHPYGDFKFEDEGE